MFLRGVGYVLRPPSGAETVAAHKLFAPSTILGKAFLFIIGCYSIGDQPSMTSKVVNLEVVIGGL